MEDIKGYEGYYMITEDGKVFSWYTSKYLSNRLNGRGYYKNVLSKNGNEEGYYVHRLVAEAFIPNPDNKLFIDHIDGDRLNNHKSNLRWATHQENCRNRNKRIDNKTGYKGVCIQNNKYKATCDRLHLGYYDTAEEASTAYQEFCKTHHGEFYHEYK